MRCDGKRRFNSAALSKKKKKDLIFRVGGRVTSLQRLWWGTERSGVRITSFSVLEGGRVVVLHARKFLYPLPFWNKGVCARSFEKTSHPPSSVKKCRCVVAWCDGKRRFNSAALSKKKKKTRKISSFGWVGGLHHCKGCANLRWNCLERMGTCAPGEFRIAFDTPLLPGARACLTAPFCGENAQRCAHADGVSKKMHNVARMLMACERNLTTFRTCWWLSKKTHHVAHISWWRRPHRLCGHVVCPHCENEYLFSMLVTAPQRRRTLVMVARVCLGSWTKGVPRLFLSVCSGLAPACPFRDTSPTLLEVKCVFGPRVLQLSSILCILVLPIVFVFSSLLGFASCLWFSSHHGLMKHVVLGTLATMRARVGFEKRKVEQCPYSFGSSRDCIRLPRYFSWTQSVLGWKMMTYEDRGNSTRRLDFERSPFLHPVRTVLGLECLCETWRVEHEDCPAKWHSQQVRSMLVIRPCHDLFNLVKN